MTAAQACAVAAAVATAALAHPAVAQPDEADLDQLDGALAVDYDLASDRWNGLSTLGAIARGLGLRVEAYDRLDWDDLDAEDVLVVLYPSERLDPGHLAAFVRNGGRVLLADDHGDSADAMARLGMLRDSGAGVGATRFYRDLPYAPVATPVDPGHPLAAKVSELTTNHPAVLIDVQGPDVVFAFGPGEAVVAAGELGTGRFVVVSDPSVFINRMLSFADNMQFAINAVRYLRRDDRSARLVVLAGRFSLLGAPEGLLDDGTVSGSLDSMMNDLNRWLDERNDYLLMEPAMKAIGVLVALLIAFLAVAAVPLIRRGKLDGSWTRAKARSHDAADLEQIVASFEGGGAGKNFLLPAAILRDTVGVRLARVLDRPDPLYSMTETELARAVEDHRGRAAAAALARVYPRLRPLPSRVQAASPWRRGYVSRRDFERLRADIDELDRTLGGAPRS